MFILKIRKKNNIVKLGPTGQFVLHKNPLIFGTRYPKIELHFRRNCEIHEPTQIQSGT